MTGDEATAIKIALTGPDKDLRNEIARSLRGLGHEVSENLSLGDALRLLSQASYDLVIVDADQLGMDLADLLKTCKRTSK